MFVGMINDRPYLTADGWDLAFNEIHKMAENMGYVHDMIVNGTPHNIYVEEVPYIKE